jgi:uncharacterized protein YqjF (DUF2071 family)
MGENVAGAYHANVAGANRMSSWWRPSGTGRVGGFPIDIVDGTTPHRPWPVPAGPWIMRQSWHDLLFAHWPVGADELRALVPPGLHLDLFDQRAWVGVIPFHMTNVAPRAVPALPWVSAFPELNVRTYVTVNGKPGVYFFSLDAGNPLAVAAARTMFHLPYFAAAMHVEARDGWIHYRSRRAAGGASPADFDARYRPIGPVYHPQPGTLDYFLTERYCLYTLDGAYHLRRLEIQHPPWPLQRAEAVIDVNTMAEAAGLRLPSMAPELHFARRQDMVAWLPGDAG